MIRSLCGPIAARSEDDADSQHGGLVPPLRQEAGGVPMGRDSAHDGEAAGMCRDRRERHVVAVASPRWRDQDGTVHPGGIHISEERRVGHACDSTCRSRWSPYHEKKKLIAISLIPSTDLI